MLTREEMAIASLDGAAYDDGGNDVDGDDDNCEDIENDVDTDGSVADVDNDDADDAGEDENNYENDITR